MLTEVAAVAAAEGTTLQRGSTASPLVTAATSRRQVGQDGSAAGAEAVERLAGQPPKEIAGAKVTDVVAYPEADLLRFELAGASASKSARAAPSRR